MYIKNSRNEKGLDGYHVRDVISSDKKRFFFQLTKQNLSTNIKFFWSRFEYRLSLKFYVFAEHVQLYTLRIPTFFLFSATFFKTRNLIRNFLKAALIAISV